MKDIRLLNANEIECRIQSVKKTKSGVGCILLLYKDARVDMKLLDETYGTGDWQRTHEVINGNLFCNIDIWDENKKCWVRKQDVGTESNTEKEKGQASDSFKRAGFNVGIGRELYTAPFVWINLEDKEHYDQNGKVKASARLKFEVFNIEYRDREIVGLEILDQNKKSRYKLESVGYIDKIKLETLKQLIELKKADTDKLLKYFNIKKIDNMTVKQFAKCIEMLKAK